MNLKITAILVKKNDSQSNPTLIAIEYVYTE